jgi:pimeloyl-ACP methyl ester carboxylesterase
MRSNFAWLIVATATIGATGCPSIDKDPNEGGGGPEVEFDPANKVIPFPNNLVRDPATGKVNLPEQCNESPTAKALREQVLNTLDGFGTFETALQVTFSEPVDMASLTDHVVVMKRATGTTPVDPAAAVALPLVLIPGTTVRFDATCATPSTIDSLVIVPKVPLEQRSTYVVALLDGVKTANGAAFNASFTWSLVRQNADPVTVNDSGDVVADQTPLDPSIPEQLEQLKGIDLLWKAHAQALAFLDGAGKPRGTTLLAWEFTTQTTTDPIDPSVTGSLASAIEAVPIDFKKLQMVNSITGGLSGEAFLRAVLPANSCQADGGPLPCQAVGDIGGGGLLSKQYQIDTPNPVAGDCSGTTKLGCAVPGPWGDPVNPTAVKTEIVETLVVLPAAGCPANGCPTVVFGHGLGSSKKTVFAIAPQLAGLGFATVAIDFVAHDSRAIRISNDATIGCGGDRPDPTKFPQCFEPILSSNLGATRDSIRQTILDLQGLVAAVKACGTDQCEFGNKPGTFAKFDGAHISYLGISLGGIIGSTTTALTPDIKTAVLNVPGVGFVDILENTQNLTIRCSLVNALIDAGILVGDKFNPADGTGLCTTDAWKTQPGYQQFAVIGRWVLDPADGANFTPLLATRRFLIQEVVGDQVVPNIATETEAALVGLTAAAQTADCAASATPPASAAITTPPLNASKFVRYPTSAPGSAGCAPGNTFAHASLLQPAAATTDARLATVRLQTDALTYLTLNK